MPCDHAPSLLWSAGCVNQNCAPLRSAAIPAVVFGDIGTSPLYTYSSLFQDQFGSQSVPTETDIKGGLACLVWALIACTVLKYQARACRPADPCPPGGPADPRADRHLRRAAPRCS